MMYWYMYNLKQDFRLSPNIFNAHVRELLDPGSCFYNI
jgi:hypothetical protein